MSFPQDNSPPISFHVRIIQHKDDPTAGQTPQEIGVDSVGKETRPADWDILGAFVNDKNGTEHAHALTSEDLIRMIPTYEMNAYGTIESETSKPRNLYLQDHKDLTNPNVDYPTSPYQKHGWQPVSVIIEPNERKKHEKWKQKKRVLDIEEMETEQCPLWDPRVDFYKPKIISYFKRSGHPIFQKGMEPPVTFEFRGYPEALGLCCLAKDDKTAEKRTIQWVLHKFNGASEEDHCVNAIKHTIRGKLKYEVRVQGTAVGDCRATDRSNPLYRQFPVDFVLQHNDIESTTVLFEEIELVYYTHISVSKIDSY